MPLLLSEVVVFATLDVFPNSGKADVMRQPSPSFYTNGLLAKFRCVGRECEDTCCTGWNIDIDDDTLRRYKKKHDLATLVEPTTQGHAMKMDAQSGFCVANQENWCTIQEKYGAEYLGQTCYFFPRILSQLGTQIIASANLSCPEITRIVLEENPRFAELHPYTPEREPHIYPATLPDGLPQDEATQIYIRIQQSLEDTSLTAEQHIGRLIVLAYALEDMQADSWYSATRFYLRTPPPHPAGAMEAEEALKLLHGVATLAISDSIQYRPRLYRSLRDMDVALHAHLHWKDGTLDAADSSAAAWAQVQQSWQRWGGNAQHPLRQWIAAQVARNLYPLCGLGSTPVQNAKALATGYATLRLALMCACHRAQAPLDSAEIRRIFQSLARLYDHISNISVLERVYTQPQWEPEDGLRRICGI